MYDEEDLLPVSALQHILFCERQCALIHVERAWEENLATAEGRQLHEKVDSAEGETRNDLRIACGFTLRSLRLGLFGKADVVEFHRTDAADAVSFEKVRGLPAAIQKGRWSPFPVEYKRGKPKANRCDEVQLCAQALCMEEMFGIDIHAGALFYAKTRRRQKILFDADLREQTWAAAERLHELIRSQILPKAVYGKKCRECSLCGICLPQCSGGKSARRYLENIFRQGE
jgi:CRISPR-associated exonuclease Cas4